MKNLISILLCVITLSIVAQTGKKFPEIIGSDLNDKSISLPFKNNKTTIVAIAFHRNAEDELKKWLNPLYYTFIKKSDKKNNFDMSEIYDVNFVFIPMISGFKKIKEDFKNSTQKEFYPYVMDTEKSDIKAHQKALNITDNKIPYIFVVDKNGIIIEMQSGNFKEDKVDKIEDAAGD